MKFRRILYPTDFSRASGVAFTKALSLAKENRAELTLVHVISPMAPFVGEGYVSPDTYRSIEQGARRSAQRRLAGLLKKATKAGVRARSVVLEGISYEQIARVARARRADLIVMGTHGRTGFSRFFMGSVAERVIPLAPCPVLTVRGR